MPVLFTLGHSVRPQEATLDLLKAQGVTLLVDVRAYPRSRRNPQYDSAALASALQVAGIAYRHMPALGGIRKPRVDSINTALADGFRGFADYMQTPEFDAVLAQLIGLSEGKRVAIMCAEAKPKDCHRSLISDALSAQGVEVRHIMDTGGTEPHALRPSAEVHAGRVSYPFSLEG
jgi:uncharacterized protein (DUF488 family)